MASMSPNTRLLLFTTLLACACRDSDTERSSSPSPAPRPRSIEFALVADQDGGSGSQALGDKRALWAPVRGESTGVAILPPAGEFTAIEATVASDPLGYAAVQVKWNPSDSRLTEFLNANDGKLVAFLVDKKVCGKSVIYGPVTLPGLPIATGLTESDAKDLVAAVLGTR